MIRRQSRKVTCGSVEIGGNAPISIQSMTKTDTRDVKATVAQIHRLESAGCQITRSAVPDMEAAKALKDIKRQINIPLVADIHFDYRLALQAIDSGVDKLRINPGNIGSKARVAEVVKAAKQAGIPIRIGVNGGSLEKSLLDKYGGPTPDALVESAMGHVQILEDLDFHDMILAVKVSDVLTTIEAYQKLAQVTDYPFHIGVTEAGTLQGGTIKSAIGIGSLLLSGIGDTLRVSLTGDPVEEIKVAKEILKVLGLRTSGINLISCPTCGRCQVGMIDVANAIEKRVANLETQATVAIMGCAVNGPGEARHADLGVACGKGEALIFSKGEILRKVKEDEIIDELMKELEGMSE